MGWPSNGDRVGCLHAACSRSPPLYVYLCAPVCAINVTYTPPFIRVSFLGLSFSFNGIWDHLFWCYWRLFLSHSSRPAFFRGERSSDTHGEMDQVLWLHVVCVAACAHSLRGLPLKRPVKWKMRSAQHLRARRSRSGVGLFWKYFARPWRN